MPISTILFDFMGTCLDWHSSIITALPQSLSPAIRSKFALQWRQSYFDSIEARRQRGEAPESFQATMESTLLQLLEYPQWTGVKGLDDIRATAQDPTPQTHLIQAWFSQPAWPDVKPALSALKAQGYEIFVHANGTTRLQLDLCKSSGLEGEFGLLMSSQMLGSYKPDPENYRKVLELLGRRAGECVMVAAHAYDLRGAMGVGEKTVYVYRWTDDVEEDQERLKREFDAYLGEGMEELVDIVGMLGMS